MELIYKTTTELIARIEAMCDNKVTISISSVQDFSNEEAQLIQFEFSETENTACVLYADGSLFVPTDWQEGCPTINTIEDFGWMDTCKNRAIVLNNMPRKFTN